MRTLRQARIEQTAFLPRFFEASELFAPIARAARTFARHDDWPRVEDYGLAFAAPPPVRFVAAAPRPRRRRGAPLVASPDDRYDAKIALRREVSTRARSWHDFLNALVWASFPRAKLALHTRQHRAIGAWAPPGTARLPNARTRELDALALIDEGAVIVLRDATEERSAIFGHALYEGLVLENRSMIARAVVFDAPALPRTLEDLVAAADEALAAALSDPAQLAHPEELPRRAVA
ncbi:MAG: DUF3025 domain-containing protein [Labilithrix sp.]|nr:DUF3025 domain-containing protein [Labilithrix sp.]